MKNKKNYHFNGEEWANNPISGLLGPFWPKKLTEVIINPFIYNNYHLLPSCKKAENFTTSMVRNWKKPISGPFQDHFGPKRGKKLIEVIINPFIYEQLPFVTFMQKIRKFYRFNGEKLAKNPISGPFGPKRAKKLTKVKNQPCHIRTTIIFYLNAKNQKILPFQWWNISKKPYFGPFLGPFWPKKGQKINRSNN